MDKSPKGHDIEKITGDAEEIHTRGTAIVSLGEQMQKSANTLQLLADDKIGKGLSMDDLRDQSDDVHGDLKKAGELYTPSGKALVAYATALDTAQSTLDRVVEDCIELWKTVEQKRSALATAQSAPPADDGDDDSSSDDDPVATAKGDADSAMTAWRERAADYDTPYENWDEAYDKAVHDLNDANDSGVHDSFWDNISSALEGILKILEIAGLVLLVLCLIIGGPILAVIAAVVAVLTLVVTIGLMFSGRKGWGDLALAIVGVIPFGKVGEIVRITGKLPKLAPFAKSFIGGAEELGKFGKALKGMNGEMKIYERAWNMGDRMVPWNQLTLGSKGILKVSSMARYIGKNFPELATSRAKALENITLLGKDAKAGLGTRLLALGEADKLLFVNVGAVNGWANEAGEKSTVAGYQPTTLPAGAW